MKLPKFRLARPYLTRTDLVFAVFSGLALLIPELPIAVRASAFMIGLAILILPRVGIDRSSGLTKLRETKKVEIIRAIRSIAAHPQVWMSHWRIVLYRLGDPGDDKLWGAAFFDSKDKLPLVEGWSSSNWQSSASRMKIYEEQIIKAHLKLHNWQTKDHPHLIFRHWDHKTHEKHIAEEILDIAQRVGIQLNEITVEKIGEFERQ